MPIYSASNATQPAVILFSMTICCSIFCPSTAKAQDMYVYPEAYYGRGSTVDGDYLRGQAAVIHAYGAQYYAAAMLAQQRSALIASQQSHYQQASIAESQAAKYQETLKRVERLEEQIEQLMQENAQLRRNLKAPGELDPAREPNPPTNEVSEQLVKVQSTPSRLKPTNRRTR